MTLSGFRLALTLSAAAIFISQPSYAGFVVNGSFENNGGAGELAGGISYATGWTVGATTDSAPYPFVFILDSNADSTGFPSVFSPPNIKVWGPGSGVNNGFTGSPDGGYFLGIDGAYATAPVFQSISGLTVGLDYTLTFYYAGSQFTDATGATTQGLQVTFGSDTVSTPSINLPSQGFSGWESFTHTFTATSATQTLSFLATGTPTGLPPFTLLDGVSLTAVEAATPEPATAGLVFAAGLLAVPAIRRYRRTGK